LPLGKGIVGFPKAFSNSFHNKKSGLKSFFAFVQESTKSKFLTFLKLH